jgi:hypothetical protein
LLSLDIPENITILSASYFTHHRILKIPSEIYVLGPTLFLVKMNDIPERPDNLSLRFSCCSHFGA